MIILKKRLIFILYIIITLAFTFLPILFSWWLNLALYVVWYLHYLVFGGCILSIAEYGKDSKKDFGRELLKSLKIKMTYEQYLFFTRYIQAPLCIGLSLLWQKVFGINPLIF
jgi:hypothetical protein